MSDGIEELYDYEVLRSLREATMFIVHVGEPVVVLGSSQSATVLDHHCLVARRRRRGGGGAVYLQPGDLWVDWWIPCDDVRWRDDVHEMSVIVGQWWVEAVQAMSAASITIHRGALIGEAALRVACFAGRGPGEIFLDNRKAVGVTQWRVREGAFISTVFHANSSLPLLHCLADHPLGLAEALDHQSLSETGLDATQMLELLAQMSAPARPRHLYLVS